jgi:2'-5' RNA ligase
MSQPSDRTPARFFVALLPPADIQAYASEVSQELSDRYQMSTSKSPPHITLQPPFLWQRQDIPELQACLSSVARTQSPLPVTLSGFGVFAPRVIFINVFKTPELLHLQAELRTRLETELAIVDPSSHRPFAPHLTVASRKLTRQTFQQAWSELSTRPVEFTFVGDRLTLLIHDGQRWQIQADFLLKA